MGNLGNRLQDRVAVVTGGGSGIGLASARQLAAEGAKVIIGDLDPGAGKAAADEVGGLFVPTDVTSEADVENLFKAAFDTYGSVDITSNNAGISPPDDDSILVTGIDAWRKVQEVNLTSVYYYYYYYYTHAIGYMRRQGKGSIINTASFVALMGAAASQISYTASKGAVLSMSRELGVQFAREGIRVNALCPGPVTRRCFRSYSPRTRSGRSAASCTFPWGGSPNRRNSPPRWRSWPVTTRRSSRRPRSWSTGGISAAYVTPCK